jgi:hypothetical protein
MTIVVALVLLTGVLHFVDCFALADNQYMDHGVSTDAY